MLTRNVHSRTHALTSTRMSGSGNELVDKCSRKLRRIDNRLLKHICVFYLVNDHLLLFLNRSWQWRHAACTHTYLREHFFFCALVLSVCMYARFERLLLCRCFESSAVVVVTPILWISLKGKLACEPRFLLL